MASTLNEAMDIFEIVAYVLLAALFGIVAVVVWLWKRVNPPPPPPTPPSLTLVIDKTSMIQGDALGISGTLKIGSVGQSGKTVSLALTPPSGDGINLTALTDASGNFSKSWVSVAPTGSWSVEVAYAGATSVAKTFTINAAMIGNIPKRKHKQRASIK